MPGSRAFVIKIQTRHNSLSAFVVFAKFAVNDLDWKSSPHGDSRRFPWLTLRNKEGGKELPLSKSEVVIRRRLFSISARVNIEAAKKAQRKGNSA